MQFRCPSRLHGVIVDGLMEIKCHSKHCGASSGSTVLHYFDLETGDLVNTKKFREPKSMFNGKKEEVRR